jgi:hypothetical protein
MQEVAPQEYTHVPDLNEQLDALLNRGRYYLTPFTCGVGVSADGERYAAVGIKLFGKSKNRKGRWTRVSVAASCPVSEGLEGLVPKMRKLYAEYAAQPHKNINFFHRKRPTRSMAGK